ncbi:ATPase [Vibrio ishigakensis]|uniref:ATPase n=1 Tax=Vibrio ishigakensis TaxID=1481914 RepID=A0A0B8NLD9_9VIBR|nr:ATPase [Vibrio ishigakensis]
MSLISNLERGGSISKYAKHGLLLGLVVTTMAGCASMSPEECKAANWHQVGYQDGQQGENPQIVNDYTEDCAEAKVVVDRIEWTKGFHEALRSTAIQAMATKLGSKAANTMVFVKTLSS